MKLGSNKSSKRRVAADGDSGVREGQENSLLLERGGSANTEAIVDADYIIIMCVALTSIHRHANTIHEC